ncbi:hypothetical protein [Alcaligenes endophyticus]|uniref:Uncharacterized protein n=1 Tax=Alcaligenes endophyticus TaxID=1929088 RepID=A0ABT8ENI2_9BURK|nr:hypothetical protein [Alcaligenes endophyticus]MCX5592845.1 hypothetical protein [Alcaligenes endophyticus]MDN4122864.1 hypothetical protein [Alcaligenes endophyticus]
MRSLTVILCSGIKEAVILAGCFYFALLGVEKLSKEWLLFSFTLAIYGTHGLITLLGYASEYKTKEPE